MSVRPVGPHLGQREAPIINREVQAALDQSVGALRRLVLDLTDVGVMTSYGLGLCIELRNAADTVGAATIIYGMSAELLDLFKMMNLQRLFTIVATRHDLARALAA